MSNLLRLAVMFGCSVSAWAAVRFRDSLGTVRDPSGAVIANAKITLRNVNTGVTATSNTDAAGNYEFLTVKIGDYRVNAEAAGFRPVTTDTFNVAVNARQRVDLTLQVGTAERNPSRSPARPRWWRATPPIKDR